MDKAGRMRQGAGAPPAVLAGTGAAAVAQVRNWVHQVCLDLPGAYLDYPFGPDAEVFRIRGRMFGLLTEFPRVAPGLVLNVKAEPEEVPRLIGEHPFIHPGFHMNKRHWVSISFGPATDLPLVSSLIEDSYDNVVLALPASRRPFGAALPTQGQAPPPPGPGSPPA